MTTRRAFFRAGLGSLAGALTGCGGSQGRRVTSSPTPSPPSGPSLRELAAAKGLLYGSAARNIQVSDAAFSAALARECGILVPELTLKFDALRPTPDRFTFSDADALADFAARNGMRFRGHTLVWHNALPGWVESTVNSSNAERILVEHITTVCRHFAGRMHSWDVVNEAIFLDHGLPGALRSTPWYLWLGPEYIPLAYRTAAAADPSALLVYNDFGLEYSDAASERKREAVLGLLDSLRASRVKIDALGLQAHLVGSRTDFVAGRFMDFVRSVVAMGIKVLVTELDVRDQDLPADVPTRDRRVAAVYSQFLETILAEPAVIAVLTWGLSDRHTWLAARASRADGLPVRPLPLDAELNRKPAWEATAAAFSAAPPRP